MISIDGEERAWIRFLETPIAELETHGLDLKFINELEGVYGIYIKHIRAATATDITRVKNFGKKATQQLQDALHHLWEEIRRDEQRKIEGNGHHGL